MTLGWIVLSTGWAEVSYILTNLGLVDVGQLSGGRIVVSLIYSITNNFLREDVYGDLEKAYLVQEAAERLVSAQSLLEHKKPGYRILVYDAPLHPEKNVGKSQKHTSTYLCRFS